MAPGSGVQVELCDTDMQTDHSALLQREMNNSHYKLSFWTQATPGEGNYTS